MHFNLTLSLRRSSIFESSIVSKKTSAAKTKAVGKYYTKLDEIVV